MFGKPGQPIVQASFNSYMIASSGRIRFENKRISLSSTLSSGLSTWIKPAIHTGSCKAFLRGRMFCPCLAQIFCNCHSTASSTVIPHIQHQHSGPLFLLLALRLLLVRAMLCIFHVFSAVFTIHDTGIRYTAESIN